MLAFLLTLTLVATPSSDPPTLLAQAHSALEAGDVAGAEAQFRHLLELTPTWVDAHLGLAAAQAAQGKKSEARTHLLRVAHELWRVEALEPAVLVLEQALTLDGTAVERARLHSLLGRIFSRQRAYPAAVEHLCSAVEALPASLPGPSDRPGSSAQLQVEQERLRLQMYLAAALWESGDPEQAEAVLRASLSTPGIGRLPASATAMAHHQLGRLLHWTGDSRDAVSFLSSAAQLRPNDYALQLDLGRALAAIQESERAIEAYRRAAQLAPEASAPHYGLARLHQVERRSDLAHAAMEQYQRLLSDEQLRRRRAGRQRATLDRAWILLRGGDAAAAATEFDRLPDSVEALVGASAAYRARGELEKAVQRLERAVELAPEREDLRLRLADLR